MTLRAASDELLAELVPLVRAGEAQAEPAPYDDPMSLYEDNPDLRVQKWLRGIWKGRGNVSDDFWRLYFVVLVGGRVVGMQDLIGSQFKLFGTVTTFSWLARSVRRRGVGREMRAAILHLAFEGLGAAEAESEAFIDNTASNRVSESLGYAPNGTGWATRQGSAAVLQRWRITRQAWLAGRRSDIELDGVPGCRSALGLVEPPEHQAVS